MGASVKIMNGFEANKEKQLTSPRAIIKRMLKTQFIRFILKARSMKLLAIR